MTTKQIDPNEELKEGIQTYGEGIGFTKAEMVLIKNTVAKGTTDMELSYFLSLCKNHDLDPFKKEIRCYKDNKGNLITIVGRDGMLKKAQSSGIFLSLNSCEVCKNDEFEFNLPTETVHHKFTAGVDRGPIVGAYAILKTSDGATTMQWASIDTYDKKQFIRNSHKGEMIKKVAEMLTLKKKFIFSGLVIEESEGRTITIDEITDGFTSSTDTEDGIN